METSRLIDKKAFRHYTPKELHPHLNGFNNLLHQLVQTNSLVRSLVEKHNIPFPVHYGFPLVHLIALFKNAQWNFFAAPMEQYKKKEGHRVVNSSGEQDVPIYMPHLMLEVVSDQALTKAYDKETALKVKANGGKFPESINKELTDLANSANKPSVLFSAPMTMMRHKVANHFLRQRFTLYQHIFGAGHEYPNDGLFYIGITSRDWKKRWSEHRSAILRGSPLKFHRMYRQRLEEKQLTYVHHKVMGVAPTLDAIQDLEEGFVSAHWEDTRLLNMIPGGKAGIKYLHEHRILAKNVIPTPDTVEKVLEEWLKEHPRKGLPAPWVSENWKDDEFALKIICGPEGRLSIEQVIAIRNLSSSGLTIEEILNHVGAKNKAQVRRVIDGKTYTRVT